MKTKAKPRAKSRKIPERWSKLMRLLPGYDPSATAAPGERFDAEAADNAVAFFPECLQHIEGLTAGQPFVLQPWQQAVVGCLFGWKRADGTRRYRQALLMIARGNGKTPLAAGICLYCLLCDGEPGAQIYSAAADTEQAALLYRHASGMVEREHELSSRCTVYRGPGHRSIVLNSDQASCYRVVSSEAGGKHGGNPHLVVCDELHAWQGRDLWDAFQTAFAKKGRRQPLLLSITTADYERPSVCNELQDYAERIISGTISDSSFLPVLYVPGRQDDWTDEATWEKANPNLDVTVDRESLRRECQRAKELPSYQNTFRRLHCNQRTETDVRWLELSDWDANAGRVSEEELVGQVCYTGMDMATIGDVAAVVHVFPRTDAPWPVLCRFFVPDVNAEARERRDRVPYLTWARQGFIALTEGNRIDYNSIRATINRDASKFRMGGIGADPWNSTQIMQQLQDEDGLPVTEFRQGFVTMNEPSKRVEIMLKGRELAHGGNPVLRWMAGNVTVRTDPAGNIKPDKERSREKIDGIVALVEAIGMAMRAGVVVDEELLLVGI
jgi:phage terminase large subunit-like protein